MSSNNNIDDEAYARMIQELEYEEARRNSHQRNPPPTAPFYSGTDTTDSSSSIGNDEEYARRVQEELQAEATRGTMPEQAPYHSSSAQNDVQLARKVEQEMRDEEMARQLEIEDQNAAAAARRASHANQPPPSPPPRRRGTFCRMVTLAVPVVIAAAIGIVLYLVFSGNAESIPFFGGNENDPFNGKTNPDDLAQWRTNDVGGLDLELVNALDETWQSEFLVAVRDWENGDPDALTLTTSKVTPESRCTPEPGKMKVCNGEYGQNGWRGINQISISNGWITQSIAKLNDSYLGGSSGGDRQYTACHEIGHGFGLPHTDEVFGNPDLGNCMDYTNNPERNKQPDESNYELLAEFYGTVDGSWPPGNSTRFLRGSDQDPGDCSSPDVMARYTEVESIFENGSNEKPEGWIPTHTHTFGEAGYIDLGHGCGMEIRLLLA